MEMEQRQSIIFPLVSGVAHQSGDFRQRRDLFRQNAKRALVHTARFRGYAFHIVISDDKPMVALLPLTLGIVADTLLQPLASVLVLLPFDKGLVVFFLQFFL